MKRTWILAGLATALLGGCATSPTGRSQLMLVSDAQMNQMGLAAFNQLKQQGKFADEPRERAYATCVADALIRVLPAPYNRQEWDVQIVKDGSANAFALPGGRIGVNDGMFKVATDQDQLAAVLGHELSHVVARHSAERFSDQMAAQAGIAALTVYGATRGNDAGRTMALLGVGAEIGLLLPWSRAQESEADVLGQRYMAAAGFDPREAVTLWQNMQKSAGSGGVPAFLSTHPAPGNRIKTLSEQAPKLMGTYEQARAGGNAPHCSL